MNTKRFLNNDRFIIKILKLGNKAVKKYMEITAKYGIPYVYCINGKIVFELPNTEL